MPNLPTGTVTFLFTDIEGSTTLLQRLGDRRYAEVLAEHQRLLRDAFARGNGQEIDTQGDAFLVAFARARDAVATAVAAQQALMQHHWPDGASLQVRMGLHTGEPITNPDRYVGLDVHRAARIGAAAHGGQILLSDATRGLVVKDLPDGVSLRDLGEHRLKDLVHPHLLFQVVAATLPADFPPIRSLDVLPNNLPRQLTSFIGREKEMAEVKRFLSNAYLVTLTGSGGAGKTRLALQVAADLLDDYRDGVWIAELAPIADPALVPKTVASALNVPEQPGRDMIEALVDALRPKALLLVLDNCEHLLAACRDLAAALLRTCPQVRILATSRAGLDVPGETLWRIPSLSVPEDIGHLPPAQELVLYDAVRLFLDRAVASTPGFMVTSANASAVAQVCHRLDGIPLAIELAAARVKVLAVEQIAARLDDRFRLLTGGSRVVLPRHQTLRAAMDWSYDLLSQKERVVLRRLSVFAGGWTLEAAEVVCSGKRIGKHEVLDLLTQLVDKSLVNVESRGGEARYGLLETVRQYGRDRLLESEEASIVRRGHRDWYLSLAERADPALRGSEQAAWAKRLEAEHDNLRAALEWSTTDESDAEAGPRLAWALMWFWQRSGYISEGREWLEKMISRASGVSASVRARVLCGAGALSEFLGDYAQARARLEASLAMFRELEDLWGAGFALHFLGHVARAENDFALATRMFEESLALFRNAKDKWGCALTLDCWGGVLINQQDYERAALLYEESVALFRELGDRWVIAGPLSGLGMAAAARGDYVHATALLEESLAMARETMGSESGATTLLRLGRVVFWQGNNERAVALFRESLALRKERGDKNGIAASIEALAGVAVTQGRLEKSARLFGAADALRETIHTAVPPAQRAEYVRHVATLQAQLDETAFAAAWAAGRAMTLEQAVEYALQEGTPAEEAHGFPSNVAPD